MFKNHLSKLFPKGGIKIKAIIPAAGFGTRLAHISNGKPKALMLIKGKPLLDYIIEKLDKIDEIDEVFLVSNAKFFPQFFEWKSAVKSRIPITLLNNGVWQNEFRKGRVNDIVSPFPKGILDDIIIVLGDNFFNFELKEIVSFFKARNADVITVYDVHSLDEAKKLGLVTIDENNRTVHLAEKPERPRSTLSVAGVYLFTAKTAEMLRKYAETAKDDRGPTHFLEDNYTTHPFYAFIVDSDKNQWHDVGSEDVYNKIK